MIKIVKIPEDRLSVLIGRRGSVKREIQKLTKTKIDIQDDVTIDGDSIDVLTAENVVKAIGRGFSPEIALLLCNEENTIEIIPLPKERKELNRMKSRLIGTKGKSRRNIETLTRTNISVFGKTVSIIGRYENVSMATDALTKIIDGATHSFVYRYLEERQKDVLKCD